MAHLPGTTTIYGRDSQMMATPVGKREPDNAKLRAALQSDQSIVGAQLRRGQHVRRQRFSSRERSAAPSARWSCDRRKPSLGDQYLNVAVGK